MAREKPRIWGCAHPYPIVVERAEGGRRARCLGCGTSGPARAGDAGAEGGGAVRARVGGLTYSVRPVGHMQTNTPSPLCTLARPGL